MAQLLSHWFMKPDLQYGDVVYVFRNDAFPYEGGAALEQQDARLLYVNCFSGLSPRSAFQLALERFEEYQMAKLKEIGCVWSRREQSTFVGKIMDFFYKAFLKHHSQIKVVSLQDTFIMGDATRVECTDWFLPAATFLTTRPGALWHLPATLLCVLDMKAVNEDWQPEGSPKKVCVVQEEEEPATQQE
jgi:hypothetical protein